MKKTVKEAREALAELRKEYDTHEAELAEKVEKEKRDVSDDENNEVDKLLDRIDAGKRELERAERLDGEAQARALAGGGQSQDLSRQDKKDIRSYSVLRAIRSLIPELNEKLEGVELEMHQQAKREAKELGQIIKGVGIPSKVAEFRDNSVTMPTQPEDGKAVVATDVRTDLSMLDMLRNALVTRQLGATYLNDLQGNVSFTTMTQRPVATWKPEVGALDKSNVKFAINELSPKRLGTYVIESLQFLQQTSPAIERKIREEISYSIAEGVDIAAIVGTGANNQPLGILNHTGIPAMGSGLGANGAAPTRANLISLETALATRNLRGTSYGWLMNGLVRGALKSTAVGTSGDHFIMDSNDRLLEYPVVMSNMVPSNLTKGTGTNLSAIIFGDWKELYIAQWGGIDLLVDPYTLAVEGQVKIVAQGFFNVLVHRPEAFAFYKDVALA